MEVHTLKHFSCLTLIHYLVSEDSPSLRVEFQALNLIQLLDHGSWGEESQAVLEKLVKYYRHKVTPKMVDALLPWNAKKVSFKSCFQITEDCLNTIFDRCSHIVCLDLSENPNLNFDKIKLFSVDVGHSYKNLTVVDLEECCHVNDSAVQNLLRNAPTLHSLNIAHSEITDKVFLINEVKQLAREAFLKIPNITDVYDSCLQSLDISGCQNITSTCIRHLCTLCGPTLRSVNMSWTKIDCTSLLYLSGLGLPAAVQYFVSLQLPENSKSSSLLQTLSEFDDLSVKVKHLLNWETKDCHDKCDNREDSINQQNRQQSVDHKISSNHSQDIPQDVEFIHLLTSTSQPDNSDSFLAMGIEPSGDQVLNSTEESVDHLLHHQTNRICHLTEDNQYGQKQDSCGASYIFTITETCGFKDRISETTGTVQLSEKYFNDVSLPDSLQRSHLNNQLESETLESETLVIKDSSLQDTSAVAGLISYPESSDSYRVRMCPFFSTVISSLCISGSVLDEEKGLQCFEMFVSMNKSLVTLRLFGGKASNLVSDKVLELVGSHCSNLNCISLEGCDRLSSGGITKLVKCTNLNELDLTGVAFIDDFSIQLLVNNLQLCHLELAETMVNNSCLHKIASEDIALRLTDLDLSWCEDIESDEGLNAVVSCCTNLRRLVLRECCMSSLTLKLLAQNCRNIRELNISSNMNAVDDPSLIMISENLPLLEKIFLDWNSYLTDVSISSLLANCPHLTFVNLEGLKQITSLPFLKIISVPEELTTYLKAFIEKHTAGTGKFDSEVIFPKLSDLPCLPHRSMTYCTDLQFLNLTYCDFIEDDHLQDIVAVTQGSIKVIEYYGEEIEESIDSLERYLNSIFLALLPSP
ncbi:hypothetical protein Btru_044601 [Bulinus truncatus]|nr:hypothetical protein Btru_044601 [Bulinus truncatus]